MQEIYNEIKSTFDKILKIPMPLTFNDNKIECNGIVLESLIEKKGISPEMSKSIMLPLSIGNMVLMTNLHLKIS